MWGSDEIASIRWERFPRHFACCTPPRPSRSEINEHVPKQMLLAARRSTSPHVIHQQRLNDGISVAMVSRGVQRCKFSKCSATKRVLCRSTQSWIARARAASKFWRIQEVAVTIPKLAMLLLVVDGWCTISTILSPYSGSLRVEANYMTTSGVRRITEMREQAHGQGARRRL